MILWLDFETRSRCDLPSAGAYNYAQDGSTEVLCMSYAFGDEDVTTWLPGQPFPARVAQHRGQIRAHNAAFERLIFWYILAPEYDFPDPALEQFYCTATQARANCGPGSLEDVGRFAGASMKKEHYQHKKYGRVFTPVFEVVDWISLDGPPDEAADAEAEAEAVEPVPAETGRRRRRAA